MLKYTVKQNKVRQIRSRLLRKLLRFFSVVTLPIPFIGISAFLIYPNYNDIHFARESINSENVASTVAMHIYSSLSPRVPISEYEDDFTIVSSVEYISPELMKRLFNEGRIAQSLEPLGTTMRIDSARVNTNLIDGEDAYSMSRGPWHFPLSSGPGDRGNFVIIGHRFAELPPSTNTFFNLDKVRIGDKIVISQRNGVQYQYTIVESTVVEKNDRTVLQDYGDHRITLITCTPLWTSDQRLVVTGILDKAYRKI